MKYIKVLGLMKKEGCSGCYLFDEDTILVDYDRIDLLSVLYTSFHEFLHMISHKLAILDDWDIFAILLLLLRHGDLGTFSKVLRAYFRKPENPKEW